MVVNLTISIITLNMVKVKHINQNRDYQNGLKRKKQSLTTLSTGNPP